MRSRFLQSLAASYNRFIFRLAWRHPAPSVRVCLLRECALASPASIPSRIVLLVFILAYAKWLLLEGAWVRNQAQKIRPRSRRLVFLIQHSFPPFTPEAYQGYYLWRLFRRHRESRQ